MNDVPYEFVQAGGYFGPKFTAVYFFENVFWRVIIPIVYGPTPINIMASIVAMPPNVRQRLVQSARARDDLEAHWADCIDYDQGRDFFFAQLPTNPATELVASVDRDLLSTIADLSQQEPNSNAMHNARLATEKALKAFLCFRHGYTIQAAKTQFQHDLENAAAEVAARDAHSELAQLHGQVGAFAPYSDRYRNRQYSRPELWAA